MSSNRESAIISERLLGITIQLKKQKYTVKVAFVDITKILKYWWVENLCKTYLINEKKNQSQKVLLKNLG